MSLSERLGKDRLVLSSDGIVSIGLPAFYFKSKAAGHLKLLANDDEHDVELVLMKMARKIVAESKYLKKDQKTYGIRLSLQDYYKQKPNALHSHVNDITA